MKCPTLVAALILAACASASAQRPQPTPTETQTKLETFQAKTGAVVIKGFARVGGIAGLGGNVSVNAMEFTDAKTGTKAQGIVIEIKDVARQGRQGRAFVDYDEIDSLIQGIDYIAKVDQSVSKLGSFEATYKTKGDLSITTFSDTQGVQAGISVGGFNRIDAYIKLADLEKFKSLVVEAKDKLAAAK